MFGYNDFNEFDDFDEYEEDFFFGGYRKQSPLQNFFKKNRSVALAFSGGVDSAYLLYEATQAGADVTAYYVKSQFQPVFELNDAIRLARELNVRMKVIEMDVLADEMVVANPENRCYYCKNRIFKTILSRAERDGYTMIIDGTNASDDVSDRPGMKALQELEVRSPLRECGLTKDEIREKSKEAGLFTWDKPAYACLATRIPTGEVITKEKLAKTERAEAYLSELGFVDFRVRMTGDIAKVQVRENQFMLLDEMKEKIYDELGTYYEDVLFDLEGRK